MDESPEKQTQSQFAAVSKGDMETPVVENVADMDIDRLIIEESQRLDRTFNRKSVTSDAAATDESQRRPSVPRLSIPEKKNPILSTQLD